MENNSQSISKLERELIKLEEGIREFEEKYYKSWLEQKRNKFKHELNVLAENSDTLKKMFKKLFKFWMIDEQSNSVSLVSKAKKFLGRTADSKNETEILEANLIETKSDEEKVKVKEVYREYREITEYKNRKGDIESKIKLFRKALDAQTELEKNKIEQMRSEISKLRELIKKSNGQFESILDNENDLVKVVNIARDWQIGMIFRKVNDFLRVRNTFLISLEEVITELRDCRDKLNNVEGNKRKVIIKAINDIGGSFSFKIVVNPIKLIAAIIDATNSYYEIDFHTKCSKNFKECLKNEEKIFSFSESYNELKYIYTIHEKSRELDSIHKKIISEVVKILELEFKKENAETKIFNSFENRYNNIHKFFKSWRPKYLTIDNIMEETNSLDKILNDMKSELSDELLKKLSESKNEQIKTNIEIPPKS